MQGQEPEGKETVDEVELAKQLGIVPRGPQSGAPRKLMAARRIGLHDELPDGGIGNITTPLDSFGEKVLKSMGMGNSQLEGDSNKRRPVGIVQYNPRPEGLGLGAIPKKELLDKIKSGKDITSKDLRSRMFDNKTGFLKDDDSLKFGDLVKVIEGKYDGLDGIIVAVDEEDDRYITIQLTLNQKNVKVHSRSLERLSELNRSATVGVQIQSGNSKMDEEDLKGEGKKKKKLKWILPNINLRIISKDYKGGKYYQEIGYVNDILDSKTFSFVMKTGEFFEDLEEKQLETMMPKIGEKVLILKGDHRGIVGVLKERNKKENSVLVKIEENQIEFIKMTQDDCSSYHEPN